MSLRQRAEQTAKQTAEATKKIGFIGQVVLVNGFVPRLYEDGKETDNCFVPRGEMSTEEGLAKVAELVKRHTGRDKSDIYSCVAIQVVPDTTLTPNNKLSGNTYISTEPSGRSARSKKRVSEFFFDHMSPEFDELEGKKVWVHIGWARLTEQYGGDLTAQGRDVRNEFGQIITYLANKKEAVKLVADLTKDTVTQDDLYVARGYDAPGIRQMQAELLKKGKSGGVDSVAPALTDIGEVTKKFHMTLKGFFETKTIEFLTTNYKNTNGDIEATAKTCGAAPGDVAIALNKPQYFKDLMAQQDGLSETEAVVKVAELTGLAFPADLATFLGIDEAAF